MGDERTLLVDIGGTFVRIAKLHDNKPCYIEKYLASDFSDLKEALKYYCAQHKEHKYGTLRIATAGYQSGASWEFVNNNTWIIDPADLKANGWTVDMIINDFEAATLSLSHLDDNDVEAIRVTNNKSLQGTAKCLIGAGTGLGLGYLHETPHGQFVQKTHGGHIVASATTLEQYKVIDKIKNQLSFDEQNNAVVFENLVSGAGICNIYNALPENDNDEMVLEPKEILAQANTVRTKAALRLFHEFFGLFAAQVVVTGNAYNGLYITGGIYTALAECNLFDKKTFNRAFLPVIASAVRHDLESTPIFALKNPYPALNGLIYA